MAAPPLMYPEKFELALRYGQEGPLRNNADITDSDRLALYALHRQAVDGVNKEPRPSMWDTVERVKWAAWKELGNRSKFEAMFMYVSAIEELAPDWWRWPELGLVDSQPTAEPPAVAAPAPERAGAIFRVAATTAAPAPLPPPATEPATAPALAPLVQLAPNALAVGGWSSLADEDAPARYRHACAVVGARLLVFGGRSSSGRLAPDLHQLNLLTGVWTIPQTGGEVPDLRWGHSMSAFRQWLVVFGGHRRRGCLNDTAFFDTEAMVWEDRKFEGALPPARGNHASCVVADRLWLFGGDAANSGVLPQTVWSLLLGAMSDGSALSWAAVSTTGDPAPPTCDHAAVAVGSRVLLLGGSNADGYLGFNRIPVFHTDTLAWSRLTCAGQVPHARAGHVAACVAAGARGGGWHIFVFGGGNSNSGFNDLHVLRPNAKWRQLVSCTATSEPASQPPPTEGAAMAHLGGMLLLFGGYTAAGATRKCFAWGCESYAADGAAAGEATSRGAAAVLSSALSTGVGATNKGGEPIVLMACPLGAHAVRHAHAAQQAFAEKWGGAQVVPTPSGDGGAGTLSESAEATSQEQALSLMLQQLERLQLERAAFGAGSASLLARARVLAAVQPCVFKLTAGGTPRTFVCFWVGIADPASGRTHVGSSLIREVAAEEVGWGRAARAPSDLNEDGAAVLLQAWRSLLRSL